MSIIMHHNDDEIEQSDDNESEELYKMEPQKKQTLIITEGEKNDDNDENEDDPVKQWLNDKVGLPQYYNLFIQNKLNSLDIITKWINLKNLENMGIKIKSHQLVLMDSVNELKLENVNTVYL